MSPQLIQDNVTCQNYPPEFFCAPSTIIGDPFSPFFLQGYPAQYYYARYSKLTGVVFCDTFSSLRLREIESKKSLDADFKSFCEFDDSSVNTNIEFSSERTSIDEEEITEEMILTSMVNNDIIVRMKPLREYKVRVKVKSIEKATPRPIEPEGF